MSCHTECVSNEPSLLSKSVRSSMKRKAQKKPIRNLSQKCDITQNDIQKDYHHRNPLKETKSKAHSKLNFPPDRVNDLLIFDVRPSIYRSKIEQQNKSK